MITKPRIIGIIPSRLESSRLPRKPLHVIEGIPLIAHVYNRAKLTNVLDDLIVATDAQEVLDIIHNLGGKAMLTSVHHKNGTERMTEVMEQYPADYYVLINGDEILLNPESIQKSIEVLLQHDADASMLAVKYTRENSPSDFKLALNLKNEVMYISRNDIPSSARNPTEYRLKAYHIMTFKPATLQAYIKMEKTPLEKIEDHEHLRLLEHGYKIVAEVVEDECISLDMPSDIPIILEYLKTDKVYESYKL